MADIGLALTNKFECGDECRTDGRAAHQGLTYAARQKIHHRRPIGHAWQNSPQPLNRLINREQIEGFDFKGLHGLVTVLCGVSLQKVIQRYIVNRAVGDRQIFFHATAEKIDAVDGQREQIAPCHLHGLEAKQLELQGLGHFLGGRLIAVVFCR